MAETKRVPGVMVFPQDDEVWIADPDALLADGEWLKLDRTTARALLRMIGTWLEEQA